MKTTYEKTTVADKGNEMQIKMHRKEKIYVENKINASKRKIYT